MFKQRLVHCSTALALVAAPVMLSVPLSGWAQIEEITVTARRREENLQEIPLAVRVFGREEVLRKGINSVDQLALLSASLGYESASSPEAQKLSIRGISPSRGRQNLAILVDGIDVTSESIAQNGGGAMLQTRFLDIERIELVKGPQSALFGRSAFNGALQYVSMDPADEFEGDFMAEGGEFDRYSFRGSVSGPMGDQWGYRLNAAVWDEEGFYENERTGDTVGGAEGWGGAVTLKWEPTDKWSFKLRGSYTDQDRQPNATVYIPSNVVTQAPANACIDQFPADPNTGVDDFPGIQSVFNCVGFGERDDGSTRHSEALLAKFDPADPDVTIAQFIEGFANPNFDPATGTLDDILDAQLKEGPLDADNQPIGFYMGSIQTANLRNQFRGTLPDQDSVASKVSLDPDPRTGEDFPGSNIKDGRLSLIAEYSADWYTFTSWTGYSDGETHGIQDWQQAGNWEQLCGTWIDPTTITVAPAPTFDTPGSPAGPDPHPGVDLPLVASTPAVTGNIVTTGQPYPTDPATGKQIGVDPAASCRLGYNNNRHELTQFSQELRFASNFKGWQQATFGVQYWDETRKFFNGGGTVGARSFDCFMDSLQMIEDLPGAQADRVLKFADGTPICGIYSQPITGELFQQVLDARGTVWQGSECITGTDPVTGLPTFDPTCPGNLAKMNGKRETEHFSGYFLLETDLGRMFNTSGEGKWTFRFEGRFNKEKTKLLGQDSTGSGSTGAGICGDSPLVASLPPNTFNFNGPPVVGGAGKANPCSGQTNMVGFFPNDFNLANQSSSGGQPNGGYLLTTDPTNPVEFHRDLGFTTAPCGLHDLSLATRDPNAIDLMLNCGTPEAIRLDCFNGIRRAAVTPFGLSADRRDVADDATGTPLGCFETFHQAETDNNWFTPKVALEWQPKDHLLFYLSWARGEKPGGFNTVPFGSRGFEPANDLFEAEVMDVTEFGYKTAWFANTLTVNGAFFFQDYTDKQVNTQVVVPDPTDPGNFNTSPKTINAGGAEVPGLELDVAWAPDFEVVGGNLFLSLSYTWLDSEYTDFALATTGGTDVYVVNNCTPDPDFLEVPAVDPNDPPTLEPVPQCIVDRSGNDLEDSPDNSAVISGRYGHPFFGGGSDWYFEFDTTYRDTAWLEDANAAQVDEWWNTNIRLGWQNERMEAVFFVNNVFDDTTFQSGFTTPGLASSFIFAHSRDTELPFPAPVTGNSCQCNSIRSIARNGPEFNSAVVVATMRPPRHWGVRFAMKFGGN